MEHCSPGQMEAVARLRMSRAAMRQKSDDSRVLNSVDLPAFVQPRMNTCPVPCHNTTPLTNVPSNFFWTLHEKKDSMTERKLILQKLAKHKKRKPREFLKISSTNGARSSSQQAHCIWTGLCTCRVNNRLYKLEGQSVKHIRLPGIAHQDPLIIIKQKIYPAVHDNNTVLPGVMWNINRTSNPNIM